MTFQFYSDPGHGWLRVDLASAKAVGLEPSSFSTFSYQQGHWLYLEEDCDLSLLIGALRERGITPVFDERHTDRRSPIRSYETYRPALF